MTAPRGHRTGDDRDSVRDRLARLDVPALTTLDDAVGALIEKREQHAERANELELVLDDLGTTHPWEADAARAGCQALVTLHKLGRDRTAPVRRRLLDTMRDSDLLDEQEALRFEQRCAELVEEARADMPAASGGG